jgi:hypothetical protein
MLADFSVLHEQLKTIGLAIYGQAMHLDASVRH